MKKEMLINVLQPEECRIAIVEDGVLEELYVERASQESYVGNIYKGKIVNIEPGIQAAFIDFGIGRNGFLHVTDVDPVYYKHLLPKEMVDDAERDDRGPRRGGGGGRGRSDDRGPRRAEADQPETHAVATERHPAATASDGEDEEPAGFLEGLDEDGEAAPPPPVRREPISVVNTPPRAERPQPKPTPAPAPPAEDEDFADFGAGLDDDFVELKSAPSEPMADVEAAEPAEPADDEEKPAKGRKPKAAARKPKAKADDGEEKPKAKAKRGKKKADDEADGGDAPPLPMPSTERRTTEDDEPEIQPFFTDESAGFDPDAPNDRFGGDSGEAEPRAFSPAEPDEGGDDESIFKTPEELEESGEMPPMPRGGRGFDDRRGGGGGRGGPRRDDRGGRGRDDRGGSRGGPPGRGGPPRGGMGGSPNKAHTRHKGYTIPPIQEIFKRGQEVIVQVIKEGIGTKGPTLSTFVSIAGRYLVLMPSLDRVGVSKKIEDRDARHRLRDTMNRLDPPKGVGFIVRTAAVDRDEKELQGDLTYLLRLWQVVVKRIKRVAAPVEIYRESDMITRTIRDIFSNDVDTIWVDEANAFAHASEFLQIVMPKFASRIRFHSETEPLFHKYRIDEEIAKINHKRLDLPGGGSIIIEQTEALVAIDVNSGNFRADTNAEENAFQMNMRAAKEIARQLRLRDLGGVIINDFIDMRSEAHRRSVEELMRTALRRDRARTKILRISEFGLIEMTRQRMQPSLKKRVYHDCPHCSGTGYVKTQETMGIEVMRLLQLAAHRCPGGSRVVVTVHAEVAFHLLNRNRKAIAALEEKAGMEVQVQGRFGVSPDLCEFQCLDSNGMEVRIMAAPKPPLPAGGGRFSGPPRTLEGGDRNGGRRDRDDRRDPD